MNKKTETIRLIFFTWFVSLILLYFTVKESNNPSLYILNEYLIKLFFIGVLALWSGLYCISYLYSLQYK
jgi:drug/metabolite transporter (DMT)-like permease